MKWELPLIVGFILLFSIWTTFPSDNNYFYTDANGFRHYVLTPAISAYDNAIDSLTNVQFTRYDNPWLAPTEITILVAGIFVVLLVKESIQLAFRNKIISILSLQNHFSSNKLSKTNELLDLETENNKDLYNYSNLIHSQFKKFKIKKLIFVSVLITFLIILLFNSLYFDSIFAFAQSENKNSSDDKNNKAQDKEKQNKNEIKQKPEAKSKRINLANQDEIKGKFKNFSEKIDRNILKILTDDNPKLTAKRMGTTFQNDKTPVYIYLKNKNLVSSLSNNIKITGSDDNIAVARLSLNEINALAQNDSVISLGMPHRAKFLDLQNFTEQTSISDSSATDPHSIQTQNFLQTIKEFNEATIVLHSSTTGSNPPFHDIPVFTEAVVILLGSTTINPTIVNEGIAFSNADNFHNAGIYGSGVTIAIIDANFFVNDPNIVANIVSSQLIDSGGLCGGSITCGVSSGNSHGTAVAQTVVSMAPNVNLLLYVIGNSVDFNNAMQDAIDNGADIISISLGFPTLGGDGSTPFGHFFRAGKSPVANKVDLAQTAGILVTVSAGNAGMSHWSGDYQVNLVLPQDIGFGELSNYQSVHQFNSGFGLQTACLNVIDFGDSHIISWNDWVLSTNDYDLYLYDQNMLNQIGGSFSFQSPPNGNIPLEEIPSGTPVGPACLVLLSWLSSENHFFHINVQDNLVDPPSQLRLGSIGTPADAKGALSVGAIDVLTDILEDFSSWGPNDDGRPKPEICAPDNTFNHQSGLNPFLGTSASAPHVAGAAALLLEQNPTLSETELRNLLINDARFNPNYSVQNQCGSNSGALYLQTPPVLAFDVPLFDDVVILLSNISIVDVPAFTDVVAIFSDNLVIDMPTFDDAVILLSSLFLLDVPAFDETVILLSSHSGIDVPIVEDKASTLSSLFSLDVPTFDDVIILLSGISPHDIPTFDETIFMFTSRLEVDVPNVDDTVSTFSGLSSLDVPTFDDATILLSSLSPHDIPAFDETVILLSSHSGIDVPIVDDTVSTLSSFSPLDVPTFDDATILLSSIFTVDEPTIFDKALLTHLPLSILDIPFFDDAVIMLTSSLEVDIPFFDDAVIMLTSRSEVDIPFFDDAVIMLTSRSEVDVLTVIDDVTIASDISPVDVPFFDDAVIMLTSRLEVDIPFFDDAVIMLTSRSEVDVPTVIDDVTIASDISPVDVPFFDDAVIMLTSSLEVDIPFFDDAVIMLTSRLEVDVPTVIDDVTIASDISLVDIPFFDDAVIMLTSSSLVDVPNVIDRVIIFTGIPIFDVPTFDDTVILLSSISTVDVPEVSDGVTMNSGLSVTDSPEVSESVLMNRDITVTDSPEVSESVLMNRDITVTDSPEVSESVLMNRGISVTDSPEVSESVLMNKVISITDSPEVSDGVTMNSRLSVTDSPEVSETITDSGESLTIDVPTVVDSVIITSDISPIDVPTFNDVSIFLSSILATDSPLVSDGVFKNLEDDEQGVTNNQEEVTATLGQPVLVITTSSAALSMVNVPEEVTNAVLNYEEILTTDENGNKMVSIDNPLTVMAETSIGMVEIELPASLTISGPNDWNGEINLPQVKPTSSVTPPEGETVDSVIELGLGDIEITFDKPVRIALSGQAGKTAFFERNGITTIIDNVCPEDNFASVNTFLNDGGIEECKIDNGNDLIIWTLHFTSFGTSSPTPSSQSSTSGSTSTSFSKGGGGGSRGGSPVAGFGGIISNSVRLYEVSWDKCNENIMRIIAGPQEEDLIVKVRTATGLADVIRAEEQPYAKKIIFEVILDPGEPFVHVQVELITERIPSIEQKFLDLDKCEGKYIGFTEPKDLIPSSQLPILESPMSPVITENIPNGSIFETGYGDIDFEINYKVAEGSITDMMIDEEDKSVTFSLENIKEKELLISLPHELISAVDDNFVILGTKSPKLDYDVIETTDEYIKLKIMLPDGEEYITIIGSNVVPEFGAIAIAVLLISILCIIAVTRSQKFSLIKI